MYYPSSWDSHSVWGFMEIIFGVAVGTISMDLDTFLDSVFAADSQFKVEGALVEDFALHY